MLSEKFIIPLMINLIFVKVLLTFPKTVVENSGNAAWIQILYNTVIAFLFFCAVMRIYNRKKNIIEIAEINGGKPLKVIAGIIVTIILIINAAPIVRIFPESVKIVLLRDMNTEIIVVIMAAAASVGAYLGLEAVSRVNRIFLPIAAAVFLGLIVLLIPKYRLSNLLPVFGTGYKKIFINGISTLSLFSDLLILNLLIPYSKNIDCIKKSGKWAIGISGLSAAIITAAYCLSFSYPTSKDFIMPAYQMTRLINISNFLSRFEAFFEFVWTILTLMYTAVYLYMICYTIQITLSLKYLKPLVLPVAIILIFISLMPPSIMKMIEWDSYIGGFSYIPVFALLLIFGHSKRMKKKENAEDKV